MRTLCSLLLVGVMLFVASVALAEKAPQAVYDLANSELKALGEDPALVAAVKGQNAKGVTLDEIKALDDKWKGDAGIADYMKALMENACAGRILEVAEANDMYAEIFVMDNQGANVCMTDKTSDYWQGDEAKFKNSFAAGAGAVFVDEVEFDDSSQSYLVQVSVPVMDGGAAIGAITFGIDVDKVE